MTTKFVLTLLGEDPETSSHPSFSYKLDGQLAQLVTAPEAFKLLVSGGMNQTAASMTVARAANFGCETGHLAGDLVR